MRGIDSGFTFGSINSVRFELVRNIVIDANRNSEKNSWIRPRVISKIPNYQLPSPPSHDSRLCISRLVLFNDIVTSVTSVNIQSKTPRTRKWQTRSVHFYYQEQPRNIFKMFHLCPFSRLLDWINESIRFDQRLADVVTISMTYSSQLLQYVRRWKNYESC